MDATRHNQKAVCSACFHDIENCTCGKFDAEILIDENMQEILINLNEKGYKTVFSCEGHFDGFFHTYVKFCNDHNFSLIPKNFKYVKKHRILEYAYKNKKNQEKFEEEKREVLKNLLAWSEKI